MRNLLDRNKIKRPSQLPDMDRYRATHLYRTVETEDRPQSGLPSGRLSSDEVLILDERASLRPAELVERKLSCLLKSVYLPMSHVRATPFCKGRGHSSGPSLESARKRDLSFSPPKERPLICTA